KGRVEWGTGRSTPMEQTAFGVDREQSRAMAEDAIKSVVHMWENEYAEWHSEFLDFPKRLVCPKPYQDPHPAPWMAATSDGSAEFTLEWEFPHFGQEQKDAYFPFLKKNAEGDFDPCDFNKQDMIIVGTPDECMKKIQHYADIGVDQLLCYVQFGYLPHKSVMR